MLHWSQERKQERTALLNPHTPETHSIPSLQAHFHLLFALLSGLFSKPEAGSNERSYSCLQACGSALSLIPHTYGRLASVVTITMHGTIVLHVALGQIFKSFKNTYPWCKPYPAKVMSCDIGVFRYLSNKLMQGTQIVGVNSGCEYGLNQVCMPRHRPDLFQLQRINVARIVIKKPSEHLLKRFFVAGAPLRFGKQGSAVKL